MIIFNFENNINQTKGIKGRVMSLRVSQRSIFPIRKLFDFAQLEAHNMFSNFFKTSLLLNPEYFTIIGLSINKFNNVIDKSQFGQFIHEFFQI